MRTKGHNGNYEHVELFAYGGKGGYKMTKTTLTIRRYDMGPSNGRERSDQLSKLKSSI